MDSHEHAHGLDSARGRDLHISRSFTASLKYGGAVQGVGLGLSLRSAFMDEHGGRVEVQSVFGKGSSFTLFFPRPKVQKANRRGAKNVKRRGKFVKK